MKKNPTQSGLTRYMKGKHIPQLQGRVRTIIKKGGDRVVVDEFGNKETLSKRQLLNAFNKALSSDQKKAAAKSIRVSKDHTATVMIGGLKKGERRTYANVTQAKLAIRRHYGK